MVRLKEAILSRGSVRGTDVIKVDSFLNHQLDIELLDAIGAEFYRRFAADAVTKILTCEASGIAIAAAAARFFRVPAVFAKKSPSKNLDPEMYSAYVYSYTRQNHYQMRVSKQYIEKRDRVLLLDDFLANGFAVLGMKTIVDQAAAALVGCGIVIEKGFQSGGQRVRDAGIRLESLVVIERVEKDRIFFSPEPGEQQ